MPVTATRAWAESQKREACVFWRDVQAFGSCTLDQQMVVNAVTQNAGIGVHPDTEWTLIYDDAGLAGVIGWQEDKQWTQTVVLGAMRPGVDQATQDAIVLANVPHGRIWPAGEATWGCDTPANGEFAVAVRRAYGAAVRETSIPTPSWSQDDPWTRIEGRVVDGQIAVWA